jgi:hypothetical protein
MSRIAAVAITAAVVLLVPLTASAQQETGWLTYEDPLGKFRFSVPDGWLIMEGSDGASFKPPPEEEGRGYASFTMWSEEDPTGEEITPKEKLNLMIEEEKASTSGETLEGRTDEIKIIESGPTTLAGLEDTEKVVYTHFYGYLMNTVIVAKKDNTFYIVEFNELSGDGFDSELRAVYNEMLKSIGIISKVSVIE